MSISAVHTPIPGSADRRQRRQAAAHLVVGQVGQLLQVQLAGQHALGRAFYVAHLPKRQPELLQLVVGAGGQGPGRHVAERVGQALPDGNLRLRGYLLPHDAVDQRREQVGRHLAAHRPDSVDSLGQPYIARLQVGYRLLVVFEITLLSHGVPLRRDRRIGAEGAQASPGPAFGNQYNRPGAQGAREGSRSAPTGPAQCAETESPGKTPRPP